jgi:hypothetical protein
MRVPIGSGKSKIEIIVAITKDTVLPGVHPHSDRPNWRPAETLDEYLFNVREDLERHSVERLTKLLGLQRTQAWRARQMTHIPPACSIASSRAG